jgi:hypothetical protein
MPKESHRKCEQLPVLHPDAAGIDVGASELFVAVGSDRDPQPVRTFHPLSCPVKPALKRRRRWLKRSMSIS